MRRFRLDQRRPQSGDTNWERVDALSDAEAEAAARNDPDAQPISRSRLSRMGRRPNVRAIRESLGLTAEKFAETFGLPLSRVHGWEAGNIAVLPTDRIYLKLIEARPDSVKLMISEIFGPTKLERPKAFTYHVIKSSKGWEVQKEGERGSSSIHETQTEAISAARAVGKRNHADVVVHRRDGKIRRRFGYGSAPSQASA